MKTYSAKSAAIRAATKQLGGLDAFTKIVSYPKVDDRWGVEVELVSGAGSEIEQAIVARGFTLAQTVKEAPVENVADADEEDIQARIAADNAAEEKPATVEPNNACGGPAPHDSNDGHAIVPDTHTEENAMQTEDQNTEAQTEEAAPEKPAKEPRVVQNDVMMPKPDSKCGVAWAIFDEVSQNKGAPATIAEGVELAEAKNAEGAEINLGNLRAEYGRWRKFHGVPPQGRAKKAAPAEGEAEAPEGESEASAE